MALYGIPSASKALTASTSNDSVVMQGLGGTLLSAQTIFGEAGNDVIDFGAFGKTAIGSATVKTGTVPIGKSTGSLTLTGSLVGSATYFTSRQIGITGGTIQSGASAAVHVTGVITSQAGGTVISDVTVNGNAGNDTILLGESLTTLTATTIGGGKGNDYIGNGTYAGSVFATAATDGGLGLSGATIKSTDIFGGDGRDIINFDGDLLATALTIKAGEDNDTLKFASGDFTNTFIGGGKGNDAISGGASKFDTGSIIGGLGQDTIDLNGFGSGQAVIIAGDKTSRTETEGGNDSIYIGGDLVTSTILGGAGKDSLTLSLTHGSGNTVYMDAGADVVSATTGASFGDSTINFGKNADKFSFIGTGATIIGTTLTMGKGLDTVTIAGDSFSADNANLVSSTIVGGLGNDLLFGGSALISNNETAETVFKYNSALESTISAFDTIGLDVAANESATYLINWAPGGAIRGTWSAATGVGATATNGVVTFSSNVDDDLTSRFEIVSAQSTTGDVNAFIDGNNNVYLFVNGGTDGNMVTQIGSASFGTGLNDASITVTDGKNISFNLG
jgi:hypothetical protein